MIVFGWDDDVDLIMESPFLTLLYREFRREAPFVSRVFLCECPSLLPPSFTLFLSSLFLPCHGSNSNERFFFDLFLSPLSISVCVCVQN